ncbi:MAG TPA: TetR/AcrR family transcriptional regulator [Chryseolinea sp.]|nr:TetR/AcrR family transcriptional regulator [Chryseolinea sp.]
MSKAKHASVWTEQGYSLFAEEGLDGIQIERLSRMLQLNKSSFYHYFGDMEVYCAELLRLHERKCDMFYDEIKHIKTIDPEYFQKVVEHKVTMIFQVQLYHTKSKPAYYNLAEMIDEKEGPILRDLWNDYLGFNDNADLAIRYFIIVRDMVYRRISLQNLTYEFLRKIFTEAKVVLSQTVERNQLAGD